MDKKNPSKMIEILKQGCVRWSESSNFLVHTVVLFLYEPGLQQATLLYIISSSKYCGGLD